MANIRTARGGAGTVRVGAALVAASLLLSSAAASAASPPRPVAR